MKMAEEMSNGNGTEYVNIKGPASLVFLLYVSWEREEEV